MKIWKFYRIKIKRGVLYELLNTYCLHEIYFIIKVTENFILIALLIFSSVSISEYVSRIRQSKIDTESVENPTTFQGGAEW